MIESVTIHNFQSHEKSYLEFNPGVNVIVGPSDSGKTTIIRAMRWVAWNRPSGDAIRSRWGGKTSVEVQTEDGCVTRTKDKIDSYILNDHNAEFAFKAFGTSVPEEISKFLNISEVNLQMQLDSPFLLSKSPGEVALYFNRIAKLEMIDKGTSNINSWLRQIASDLKYTQDNIPTVEEELKQYEYLEKAEIELEVLEGMDGQFRTLCTGKDKLEVLISTLEEINCSIEVESVILPMEDDLNDIFANMADLKKLEDEHYTLYLKIEGIGYVDFSLEGKQALLTCEEPVNNLLVMYQQLDTKSNDKENLFLLMEGIKSTEYELENAEVLYKKLEKEFKEKFPKVCPLCGQEVKHGSK